MCQALPRGQGRGRMSDLWIDKMGAVGGPDWDAGEGRCRQLRREHQVKGGRLNPLRNSNFKGRYSGGS